MKNISGILSEKRLNTRQAVNVILSEGLEVGQSVAVVDDVVSGWSGAKGKVKAISDSNPGFADVALENGTVVPMQASLLVPL